MGTVVHLDGNWDIPKFTVGNIDGDSEGIRQKLKESIFEGFGSLYNDTGIGGFLSETDLLNRDGYPLHRFRCHWFCWSPSTADEGMYEENEDQGANPWYWLLEK